MTLVHELFKNRCASADAPTSKYEMAGAIASWAYDEAKDYLNSLDNYSFEQDNDNELEGLDSGKFKYDDYNFE